MKSESNLVMQVWETVRDHLPAQHRVTLAISLMKHFQEFGFEREDFVDVLDEDEALTAAFRELFEDETDDYEDEFENDYE